MNKNVRMISQATAAQSPPSSFRPVNIATDGNDNNQWQTCTQITASQYAGCAPGEIPTVVAIANGAGASLPKNGLKTIYVSGYSAPS